MRVGIFLVVSALLMMLWITGFLMFHVASALLHLVLLLAVVALLIHLFGSRRPAGPPSTRDERLL